MNRFLLPRWIQADSQNLFNALSTRQFLAPHEPVSQSLGTLSDRLGVCPGAIEQALNWLQLDGSQSVGRLRRTELMQLARSIHRFWRQRTDATAEPAGNPPQPTERHS